MKTVIFYRTKIPISWSDNMQTQQCGKSDQEKDRLRASHTITFLRERVKKRVFCAQQDVGIPVKPALPR